MKRNRLPPQIFKVPKEKIKTGYYSDKYFVRTREILTSLNHHPIVLAQIFCKKHAVVAGLDEAIAILKECTEFEKLTVRALYDGEEIKPWEVVMEIEGDLTLFCHLETVILGVIARPTATATKVRKLVNLTSKPILFFSSRFDHYRVQAVDGYAAKLGGAKGICTDAGADYWGEEGIGTMPHSLIAGFKGNTVEAVLAFDQVMPPSVNRIALVDWDNDCIGTACKVVEGFKKNSKSDDPNKFIGTGKGKLWGVRFDTAENIRDKSVPPSSEMSLGVSPYLVWKAREEFDKRGWKGLKIIVSGGFDEKKIELFEKLNTPVDAYGVGSAIFKEKIDFTMDVVRIKEKGKWMECAKVGRKYRENPRLEVVK
jgi:nicotinate phosphoribosyltransferase